MARAKKALLVPLVVALIWALPRDRPDVDVASAALVDVSRSVAAEPIEAATSSSSPDSSTTSTDSVTTASAPPPTSGVTTSTILALVAGGVAETTATIAPTSTQVAPSVVWTTAVPTTTSVAPTTTIALSMEQEALNRVSFDWQSAFPNWRIEFKRPRSGIRALTYPAERRIEVFVRADDTAGSIHRVLAHELGHVVDVELNSDADRQLWREQRGLPSSAPWWPSAEAPDFATGAGDFAEAFAVMETGVTSRSTIGDQPDAGDIELLRELMRR